MVRPSSTLNNLEFGADPCVAGATCDFAGAPANKQPLATHAANNPLRTALHFHSVLALPMAHLSLPGDSFPFF